MAHDQDAALVVIPTLNEAAHIEGLLDQFGAFARRERAAGRDTLVAVVDGGSSDATPAIVRSHPTTKDGLVVLLNNVHRIQSAGINQAVDLLGAKRAWLIRVDAHARYPDDYPEVLIAEAKASGAASVVVAMHAVGKAPVQQAIALAQNSRIGNGGAGHRTGEGGRFVPHGHHALMRLCVFRAVGGYDPSFSHNEDAELDLRLTDRGFRIWQTARTGIDYIPRATFPALARQYARFGGGRARTLCKHWNRHRPQPRQMVVISLAPLVWVAALAPAFPVLAAPTGLWLIACLLAGPVVARGKGGPALSTRVGMAAGVMHLAWSAGFWLYLLKEQRTTPTRNVEAQP